MDIYLGAFILRINFSYSSSMLCEKLTEVSEEEVKVQIHPSLGFHSVIQEKTESLTRVAKRKPTNNQEIGKGIHNDH